MAKYPILYAPDADDFFNMGLGPLTTSLTATVAEERNGSFVFESEVLTDDAIYPLIEHNGIIKADAGHILKDQLFRVKRIVPTESGKAQIYAEHVSYLSQELSLLPEVKSVSLNANSALSLWKASLNEANPFVVDSDITTTGRIDWRIDKVANPRQALGGVEGSLLDIYGGEYRFDNYHISLLKKRGTTANTVLAYGRNIKTFEQEENLTSTYTSVYPYAIYTNGDEQEIIVTLDEKTVHCANVGAFPNPVVKAVDFSGEFEHDEVPTQAKLRSLAQTYVEDNEFGVPSVSIKVSFMDLSKTADYAEYQALEEVNLCDDVRVIFPKLGVNTVAKVTRTVWNILSESYDEIEIGERRASLSTIINDQGKQIGKAEENANNALVSANGKNTTFYGLYGPDGLGEPKANKVGDLWYKPNGDETEMYQWNGTIWEFVMSTAPNPELIQAIEEVDEKVEQAQSDAGQALTNANDAVSKATNAAAKADQSSAAAAQAQSDAATALTGASTAKENAQTALNQSATAIADAKNALDQYAGLSFDSRNLLLNTATPKDISGNATENQLRTLANLSKPTFGEFGFKIGKSVAFRATIEISGSGFAGTFHFRLGSAKWVQLNPNSARYPITKAETVTFEVVIPIVAGWEADRYVDIRLDDVPATVNLHITEMQLTYSSEVLPWARAPEDVQVSIENLGDELQAKVSQTVFDTLNQKVTNQGTAITANTKAIELKADQTVVETLNGRVTTAEGSITAIAGEVKLKANQTVVDSLTGRVSTAEGSITTLAGKVALKAEKSYVDTVKDTVDSVQSDLTVEAGKISALNTLTNGHTTQIGSLQSSYDGLSSTVSKVQTDLTGKASVTDFSNLSQTVSVIQGTVANKAEQSQVTQLAGQISSLISDRKLNLLVNSDFREGTTGWSGAGVSSMPIATASETEINRIGYPVTKYMRPTQESLAGSSAYPVQTIANPESYKGKKLNFAFSYATTGGFTNSPLQAVVRYTLDGVNSYVTFTGRSDYYLDISSNWNRVNTTLDFTNIASTQSLSDIRISISIIASRFTTTSQRCALTAFQATEDGNMYQWGYGYCLGVDYAQTTMLKDLINLRVTKDDVVNQINISPDGVLIASNKVQITGLTYIESGVIKTAHIADAAITDAKIGNLSASKITAGILNAANVSIINLDVNSLTGNLTNFVKTYWTSAYGSQVSITGSAIEFVTSTATARITAGGLRIFSNASGTASANFAVGKWKDINDNVTNALGIFVGSSSTVASGTDFTAFTDREGKTYMLFAGPAMDYGANPNITLNALNLFRFTRFNEDVTFRGTYTNIFGTLTFKGMSNSSIQFSETAQTLNFRVGGGVSGGSYFWFNQKIISADGFSSSSLLSLKNVKSAYQGDALGEICKTDIVEYEYKNRLGERQLSPIIDDVHRASQYYLPEIINDGESVNLYAMTSMAWLAIKQLNKKIEELERKLAA